MQVLKMQIMQIMWAMQELPKGDLNGLSCALVNLSGPRWT